MIAYVEAELRNSGRLDGLSTMVWLRHLQRRGVTAGQKAGLRLVLAMYGERVDPSAHALIRRAIAA